MAAAEGAPLRDIEQFTDAAEFAAWLEKNHADHPGIRMKISKRGAALSTVSYDEALDIALRFGWIDGPKASLDAQHYLQSFMRRRPRSMWSKRNVVKATALIESGEMHPAGRAQVEAAKADGRWDRAYEGQRDSTPSPEFLAALEKNPAAKRFYETLSSGNRYAIYFRIHNAKKQETRDRRIAEFVEMLARGEKLH